MALVEGSTNTLSDIDAALKQLYKDKNEASHYFDERPGFGLTPKDEAFGGRNTPIVQNYSRTGGRSASFAAAQAIAAAKPKRVEDFLLTGVPDYSLIRVPGQTLRNVKNRTQGWEELVASLAQKGMDDGEENLANALETYIYRSGTGVLCEISVNTNVDATTATLTLTNPEDVCLFEMDDHVVACGSTGTVHANTNAYVSGISVPDNTITVTETTAGTDDITIFDDGADSSYLAFRGDPLDGGSSNTKITGYEAWIPTTAPSASESFFGVDRSVSSRLYGKYFDYSGKARRLGLFEALTQIGLEGGSPTLGLCCYTEYRALLEELDVQKVTVSMNPMREQNLVETVGFSGVKVEGPKKPLNVTSAIKMLPGECLCINPSDWTLHSCGPAIQLENADGLTIMRLPSEDAYEGRMVFEGQLSCLKPGKQCRVKIADAPVP